MVQVKLYEKPDGSGAVPEEIGTIYMSNKQYETFRAQGFIHIAQRVKARGFVFDGKMLPTDSLPMPPINEYREVSIHQTHSWYSVSNSLGCYLVEKKNDKTL